MGIPLDVLSELYIDNKFLFYFIQRKLSYLLAQSYITKKNIAHMRRSNGNIDIVYFNSDGICQIEEIKQDDLSISDKIKEAVEKCIIDAEMTMCLDESLDEDRRMNLAFESCSFEIEDCVN